MKKIILFALMGCLVMAFAFGYTVENVTGRVVREAGSGEVELKLGEIITDKTVINTGVASSVVLKTADGKTFTIPAVRKGTVAELEKAVSGVRMGGSIATTETGAAKRTVGQIGTASARASDQAAEDDIAAE